jgi:hypothetical protein
MFVVLVDNVFVEKEREDRGSLSASPLSPPSSLHTLVIPSNPPHRHTEMLNCLAQSFCRGNTQAIL